MALPVHHKQQKQSQQSYGCFACIVKCLQGVSQVVTCVVMGFTLGLILAVGSKQRNQPVVTTELSKLLDKKQKLRNPNNCTLPPNSVVTRIHRKFDLVVYEGDDFLSDKLKSNGYWEIEALSDMAQLAPGGQLPPPPAVVYDIGASLGYYTFLFASAGYNVVAVEPEAGNCALFRASLCLNPDLAARVTLLETAVVGPQQQQTCRLSARVNKRTKKYLHSIPALSCPPKGECNPKRDLICQENVPVTTIDAIVASQKQNNPPPAIVKIDAMGQELGALLGAQALLQSGDCQLIQYQNKDTRVAQAIANALGSDRYEIGTARGHDQNTVAQLKKKK